MADEQQISGRRERAVQLPARPGTTEEGHDVGVPVREQVGVFVQVQIVD